jgi:hypothetical protein
MAKNPNRNIRARSVRESDRMLLGSVHFVPMNAG